MPALTRIGGVLVQLVEIPGLIEGASDDRGGGRALLGVLRSADAIVYCVRATGDAAELEAVRTEVAAAGIDKPAFLAATQADEAPPGAIDRLAATFLGLAVVPVSVLDEPSLDAFRDAVWALTGLIRVWLRKDGTTDEEPLALDPASTVADVANSIHHDLASNFSGARVWGPSARFEGQRVGREHQVSDGDVVDRRLILGSRGSPGSATLGADGHHDRSRLRAVPCRRAGRPARWRPARADRAAAGRR